jgi:hypothetical protein
MTATTTTSHELVELSYYDQVDPSSLFCFMLVVPWGEEPELVNWQYKEGKGIFQCDKYAVYSNETRGGLSGLPIRVFQADLYCPLGGQWDTRLNTPMFIKLWEQVVYDGLYKSTAWTVKLDPDTVFFPSRLRDVVARPDHLSAQDGNGLFSYNCEYKKTLHGPIELLSRRALEVYADDHKEICTQPPQEDVYLRRCLRKLGVRVLQDFVLLAEEYCYWNWKTCEASRVTFHPFKNLQTQRDCFARAEEQGKWTTRPKSKDHKLPIPFNT